MILPDVNVLLYAHREDALRHADYRQWLDRILNSGESFAVSDLILSSVLRIATNAKAYAHPTPLSRGIDFVHLLRDSPDCTLLREGPRHWEIFINLCRKLKAQGNLMTDCYLAALAIEHRCEWITHDRHFARFPGLRWRHPLD